MAADLLYKSVPGLCINISRAARYLPKPVLNNIPSLCVTTISMVNPTLQHLMLVVTAGLHSRIAFKVIGRDRLSYIRRAKKNWPRGWRNLSSLKIMTLFKIGYAKFSMHKTFSGFGYIWIRRWCCGRRFTIAILKCGFFIGDAISILNNVLISQCIAYLSMYSLRVNV